MEAHFCEIILNLDQGFRSRCGLKVFLLSLISLAAFLFSETILLCNYAGGHYKKYICKINLNWTSGSGTNAV